MIDRPQVLELLRSMALFCNCDTEELEEIAGLFREVHYQPRDVVSAAGVEDDRFYVVVDGELKARLDGKTLRRVEEGGFIGEMALLMDTDRNVEIVVSRRRTATLLELSKRDFNRILFKNQKILETMARSLAQRLSAAELQEPPTGTPWVGVVSEQRLHGSSFVAEALACLLRELTGDRVLLLSLEAPGAEGAASLLRLAGEGKESVLRHVLMRDGEPERLALEVNGEGDETEALADVLSWIDDPYGHAVLDLGSFGRVDAHRLCDVLVKIVEQASAGAREDDKRQDLRIYRVVNLYNPHSRRMALNHCEPFVVPDDRELRRLDPRSRARHLIAHPRSAASPPLRRLARKIMGQSVGVALGGGAAFGVSHVGVLRTLEDEGVPIDLICGTSMGSIVALAYAAGMTPKRMQRIADRLRNLRTMFSLLDFTITRPGLLAGDGLHRLFSPFFQEIDDFKELIYPCRAVATDVETGERVSISAGRIGDAFRASASIPLVLSPVRLGKRVLVDGAIHDPVPAGVVQEMGADVCIAVNVIPLPKRGAETVITRLSRQLDRLNPLSYLRERYGLPNMLDIGMNSMQTLQYELGTFKAITADVRINPNLTDFTWTDFDRAPELIEKGAAAARAAMPDIRRVLKERGFRMSKALSIG